MLLNRIYPEPRESHICDTIRMALARVRLHQSSQNKNHQTSITEFVTSSAEMTANSCNLIRPHQKD